MERDREKERERERERERKGEREKETRAHKQIPDGMVGKLDSKTAEK